MTGKIASLTKLEKEGKNINILIKNNILFLAILRQQQILLRRNVFGSVG